MKSRSLMEAGAFLLLSFMLSVALAGTAQAGPQQAGPAPIEPVTGDEPPPSVIARKLQELFAVADSRQLSGSARTRAIVQAHGELFGDERNRATLDGVTDSNLDLLFQAAREVEFYTGEMSHVLEMMRLHEELESRGIAEGQHRADLYGALIHARLFDRARTFERAHPTQGLEKLRRYVKQLMRAEPARRCGRSALMHDCSPHGHWICGVRRQSSWCRIRPATFHAARRPRSVTMPCWGRYSPGMPDGSYRQATASTSN